MSMVDEMLDHFLHSASGDPVPMPHAWAFLACGLIVIALGIWGFRFAFLKGYADRREASLGNPVPFGVEALHGVLFAFVGMILLVVANEMAHILLPLGPTYTDEEIETLALQISFLSGLLSSLFLMGLVLVYNFSLVYQIPMGAPKPAKGDLLLVLALITWWTLMYGMSFSNTALVTMIDPDYEPKLQGVAESYQVVNDWAAPAAIMSAAIAAPIVEEIVFRAFLFGGLRRAMGFFPAAFLSSACFLLVHLPWQTPHLILPIMGLGFAIAWIYENTRNIWYPIAFHAMHNFATIWAMGIL